MKKPKKVRNGYFWVHPELKRDFETYFYELIKQYGPMDRDKMVELTDIPRTTIYDFLQPLLHDKRIEKFPFKSNIHPGRPRIYYRVNGE